MEKIKNIDLEPAKYNVSKEFVIRGVKLNGSLSPYDIPRQAKVSYDARERLFKIHFVYLTPDEPTKELKTSSDISLYLGQSSGKLYDIYVRGQAPENLLSIRLQLVSQLHDLAAESEVSNPPNYIKELNLLAAEKFLDENHEVYEVTA